MKPALDVVEGRIVAYDERSGKGLVRHIYVRVNRAGESLCCVATQSAWCS